MQRPAPSIIARPTLPHLASEPDTWTQRFFEESAWLVLRRLRSSGRHSSGSSRGGGDGEGSNSMTLGMAGYIFYGFIVLTALLTFCCVGRFWIGYKREGGTPTSAARTLCMMVRYCSGCHSSKPCWFVTWLFRHCCWSSRYRTMPERSAEMDGEEEDRWERSPSGRLSRIRTSESVGDRRGSDSQPIVLGQEYLAAQARTVVAPFKPPRPSTKSEDAMTECIICLEPFTEGDPLRTLPCMHRYHKPCIDSWLTVRLSCPLCNAEFCRKSATQRSPSQTSQPQRTPSQTSQPHARPSQSHV